MQIWGKRAGRRRGHQQMTMAGWRRVRVLERSFRVMVGPQRWACVVSTPASLEGSHPMALSPFVSPGSWLI